LINGVHLKCAFVVLLVDVRRQRLCGHEYQIINEHISLSEKPKEISLGQYGVLWVAAV